MIFLYDSTARTFTQQPTALTRCVFNNNYCRAQLKILSVDGMQRVYMPLAFVYRICSVSLPAIISGVKHEPQPFWSAIIENLFAPQ